MKDYYAVLGILPSAEDVVIRAAYKALAQRYHPDRYTGSQEDAHKKMSELNEAYSVISDPAKRSEYDKVRNSEGANAYDRDTTNKTDADSLEKALAMHDSDWKVACDYYPELQKTFDKLKRINKILGFMFKCVILEFKDYKNQNLIADELELNFLRKYFGDDKKIINFARELIHAGNKNAAAYLNKSVAIIGASIPPNELIAKIRKDFNVPDPWELARENAEREMRKHDAAAINPGVAPSNKSNQMIKNQDAVRRNVIDEACKKEPESSVLLMDLFKIFVFSIGLLVFILFLFIIISLSTKDTSASDLPTSAPVQGIDIVGVTVNPLSEKEQKPNLVDVDSISGNGHEAPGPVFEMKRGSSTPNDFDLNELKKALHPLVIEVEDYGFLRSGNYVFLYAKIGDDEIYDFYKFDCGGDVVFIKDRKSGSFYQKSINSLTEGFLYLRHLKKYACKKT